VTRTPLSRSKGQRSTCRGRGHIVAASRTACCTNFCTISCLGECLLSRNAPSIAAKRLD